MFKQVDPSQFRQTIKSAKWQYVGSVWGLTVILFWLRSFKMKMILTVQGCHAEVGRIFGATVVTALYSLVLPGILSTGVKWYILKKDTGRGSNILSSMVYNQLSTLCIMTSFGIAALMFTNPVLLIPDTSTPNWVLPLVCALLLVAMFAILILVFRSDSDGRMARGAPLLLRPLPTGLRTKLESLLEQAAVFHKERLSFHTKIALFTTLDTLIGGALTYYLAAQAVSISVPLGVYTWLCAVIYVLGRLPVTVASLGIRESMSVGLLAMYGVDKSAALLMSMILFSALVFMALIGAGYQLAWSGKRHVSKTPSERS